METHLTSTFRPIGMNLARTSEIDEAEYERFLDGFAARPGAALGYHYPFYLRFLAGTVYPGSERRFVVARAADGAIAGVMPGLHLRTAHVNAWLSLAYFGPNAGALVTGADAAARAPIVHALVTEARADARARGCRSMTIYTPLDDAPDAYRAALEGADFDLDRVAQCMPIPRHPGESPWPRKVRYDVRRAASLGVTVAPISDEADLARLWDIYRQNAEDVGFPLKPLDHLRSIYRSAGAHGIFLQARHDGEMVAGLICLMGGGVVSYYVPCTRAAARPLQPGLLLLDHAVRIAREAGCSLLNFEGSPGGTGSESSVFKFKARCGGVPVPYRVLVKLLDPRALGDYRALTPAVLAAEAPQAFIVPFNALW